MIIKQLCKEREVHFDFKETKQWNVYFYIDMKDPL